VYDTRPAPAGHLNAYAVMIMTHRIDTFVYLQVHAPGGLAGAGARAAEEVSSGAVPGNGTVVS
jgi:hypothetical protein